MIASSSLIISTASERRRRYCFGGKQRNGLGDRWIVREIGERHREGAKGEGTGRFAAGPRSLDSGAVTARAIRPVLFGGQEGLPWRGPSLRQAAPLRLKHSSGVSGEKKRHQHRDTTSTTTTVTTTLHCIGLDRTAALQQLFLLLGTDQLPISILPTYLAPPNTHSLTLHAGELSPPPNLHLTNCLDTTLTSTSRVDENTRLASISAI